MATSNAPVAPGSTLTEYEDRIGSQLKAASAKLDEVEAAAKTKGAQAEITVATNLKATKANIDRKLQDLRKTQDVHAARAKSDIDQDVAAFKASVDSLVAKVKTNTAK